MTQGERLRTIRRLVQEADWDLDPERNGGSGGVQADEVRAASKRISEALALTVDWLNAEAGK